MPSHKEAKSSLWLSTRMISTYVLFAISLSDTFKRYSISLAIIAMTDTDKCHNSNANNTNSSSIYVDSNETQNANATETYCSGAAYDWDRTTKANILSSFYYSYVFSVLASGYFVGKCGARWGMGVTQLLSSVIQFFMPLSASLGPAYFAVLRGIDGVLTGFVYVGTCAMIGSWAIPKERGIISGITITSFWIGIPLTFTFTGTISSSSLGWQWTFYFGGIFGLINVLIWFIFAYDSPDVHPRISSEERKYINAELSFNIEEIKDEDKMFLESSYKQKLKTPSKATNAVPWLQMISNKPFLVLCLYQFFSNCNYYTTVITFPQYLDDVHHVHIKNNGLLNCLPYICALPGSLMYGKIVDILEHRSVISRTRIRKSSALIFGFGSCLCFVGIGIWGENLTLSLFLLGLSGFLIGISCSLFTMNFADITPRFAGEAASISNAFANIPGYLAPLLTGVLTKDKNTQKEWGKVFLIIAALSVFGSVVYSRWGSGEVQDFNNSKKMVKRKCVKEERPPQETKLI